MYAIPLLAIVVIALIATAWSPILALIVAVPAFVLFLAYVGMRRRADERIEPPAGSAEKYESDTPKGIWGEPREQ